MTDTQTPQPVAVEQGLLPCPFCGGDALSARVDRAALPTRYRVFCRSCLGRTEDADTRDLAIAAWNTRARLTTDRSVGVEARDAVARIVDPYSFCDVPFTDDPTLLDMVEQSKGDALRKADRILAMLAATPPVPATSGEALRLAYKTGHTEGYIDAKDDGTGNGYCDHDAAEEGWQQYREKLGAQAVHIDASVSTDSANDLSRDGSGVDAARPAGADPSLAVPATSGEKLALQAIKAVCATTKDAVKGLSRIVSITRQAGVVEPYSELLKDRRVEMIVQLPRTEWQHLFGKPTACEVPPFGWSCSRGAGHDGPCAAVPAISGEGEKLREAAYGMQHPDYPNAPRDWDGGDVRLDSGKMLTPDRISTWSHGVRVNHRIVGYTTGSAQPSVCDHGVHSPHACEECDAAPPPAGYDPLTTPDAAPIGSDDVKPSIAQDRGDEA